MATLDLSACGGGTAEVSVAPTGEVCATVVDRAAACVAVPGPSPARLQCGDEPSCRVDIYPEASDVPAPFRLQTVRFTAGEPREPRVESGSEFIRPEVLRSIYGLALTAFDDRIVVSTHHDDGATCAGDSWFVFIDPTTLNTERVAAPNCPRLLLGGTGGFWAVHHNPDEPWSLSAFDRRGSMVQTVRLTEGELASLDWRPEDIYRSPDGEQLWVVLVEQGDARVPGTGLAVFRVDDLTRLSESTVSGQARAFGTAVAGDRVVLASYEDRRLTWYRPLGSPLTTQVVRRDSFRQTLYRPYALGPDRVVIGADGAAGALIIDRGRPAERISHYGRANPQATTNFVAWDDTGQLLAVGFRRDEALGREALAMLLDPVDGRFLPGVWSIGFGVATDMVRRGGRHFVLLPWAGEVAVLDRISGP